MPKGIPKQAPGGDRDEEYPEDGVLRKVAPKRQRAPRKGVRTKDSYNGRLKPYDPDQFDLEYDHPDLYKGGYSPEKKVQAAGAYMICGTYAMAEKISGVPAQTISSWARESAWWPAITAEMKKERNQELDVELTKTVHLANETLQDRLENGEEFFDSKSGEMKRRKVSATAAAKALSVAYANRALLRGDPTSRVEKISTEERLSRLGQEFQKFSKARDVTDEVIVTTEGVKDGDDNS